MTAPLTDEPTLQQILDKLVGEACHLDEPDYSTAIANAAEQIRQQERKRVERVRRLLLEVTFQYHRARGCNQHFERCEDYVCATALTLLGIRGIFQTIDQMREMVGGEEPKWFDEPTLKELEAE